MRNVIKCSEWHVTAECVSNLLSFNLASNHYSWQIECVPSLELWAVQSYKGAPSFIFRGGSWILKRGELSAVTTAAFPTPLAMLTSTSHHFSHASTSVCNCLKVDLLNPGLLSQ